MLAYALNSRQSDIIQVLDLLLKNKKTHLWLTLKMDTVKNKYLQWSIGPIDRSTKSYLIMFK
jgi:hypothetical protein